MLAEVPIGSCLGVRVVPGSAVPNRGRGTGLTGSHKGSVSWCHGKWGLQ